MNKSYFACSCAQRPACFEIYVAGEPVNTHYPFLCEACLNKSIMAIFATRKVEEVPQWLTGDLGPRIRMPKLDHLPKWGGERAEAIPRPQGISVTEERVAEVRKHTDVRILELEIEDNTVTARQIITLEKEPQNEPI